MYILIVEDSRTQAEVLRNILTRHNYDAVIAKDGKRALELVRLRQPSLIISDVVMPVMDGYGLCNALKKDVAFRDIPVILLTALSDPRDVARALQSGADNFITKPYHEDYLLTRVKSMLAAPRRCLQADTSVHSIPFSHDNEEYHLPADRMKVFDFLLSAYETAIFQHTELKRAQENLRISNENLSHLNQIISIGNISGHPDETLSALLENAVNLLGYQMGGIFFVGEDGRSVDFPHVYGRDPAATALAESLVAMDLPEPAMQGLCSGGNSLYFSRDGDLPDAARFIFHKPEIETCTVLPLFRECEVMGGIVLFNGNIQPVTDEGQAFLETVRSEIETAIEKVFLLKRLEYANDETNLYLDIMTHDINNANTSALGYLEILTDSLEDPEKRYAAQSLMSVNQSIDIIANVSTIRRMHERKTALSAVRLDVIIRAEIKRYVDVTFQYEGTDAVVLADDLISQIFMNLLGNSVKFATKDPTIAIHVEGDGQYVVVRIMDNGPGISDEMKPLIFDRFRKGVGKKSGKGLGLFIVRKLVEEYGGNIQAEDRVPGRPEEGASIRFTLQASP